MKNILFKITFIIGCLIFGFTSHAQKLIVTDGVTSYDDSERSCIIVQIEPDTKEVKDELKDWMKDKKDVRLKGFGFLVNKDVLTAEKINLPTVSSNQMDFFAEVVENGEITEMRIFGSFGYNIHISKEKYPKEYRALKTMTIDFLSDFLPEYYQGKIENTQELISDLANEREALKEDIEDNQEEIVELKEENEGLSGEVTEKGSEIKDVSKKLKKQEKKLKAINEKLKAKGGQIEN